MDGGSDWDYYYEASPGKRVDGKYEKAGTTTQVDNQGAIKPNEVTTFESFVRRSSVGDNLEGHEVLQHANLKQRGLATTRLSTLASKNNPVIALDKAVHLDISAAQRTLKPREQSGIENIRSNISILRRNGRIPKESVDKIERAAMKHNRNLKG